MADLATAEAARKGIDKALGNKEGITRFGHAYVPMDDALARVVIDLSGRSYLVLEPPFDEAAVGEFPVGLAVEFFRAVADHGNANIHNVTKYHLRLIVTRCMSQDKSKTSLLKRTT